MGAAMWRFWRSLSAVDCVWLLGPNPFAIVFAVLATLRRKRIVLGVRQDYPTYVRTRHPGRRGIRVLAAILDLAFRGLARIHPVIVVGPQLTEIYRRAPGLLEIAVSLVEPEDIVAPAVALDRSYEDELRIISVGRLEEEKNPLLLAAGARRACSTTVVAGELTVCGEGPMADDLEAELERLGVADRASTCGATSPRTTARPLPTATAMRSCTSPGPRACRRCCSRRSPPGCPTVATDVGGIGQAVGDGVLLVPPGRPDAAVEALEGSRRSPSCGHG